jgi:hypothetical protein
VAESVEERIDRLTRWASIAPEIRVDDVEWLLSLVGTGEREYRVEWREPGEDAWRVLEHCPSLADALRCANDAFTGYGDPMTSYRVTSAPVQVWTVEEEQ